MVSRKFSTATPACRDRSFRLRQVMVPYTKRITALVRAACCMLLASLVSATTLARGSSNPPWTVDVPARAAAEVGISASHDNVALFAPGRLCLYHLPAVRARWCVRATATSVAFGGSSIAYTDRSGHIVVLNAADSNVLSSACLFHTC